MHLRKSLAVAGFLLLTTLSGCSGGHSGPLATVSGTVTMGGAPLDGAKVTFHSTVQAEGTSGTVCSAMTDSSGKYLIAMVGKEPGIPPGMYKVTVTKTAPGKGPSAEMDEGQLMASGTAKNTIGADYEDANTTKLSVTLEAGKNENKDFNLKKSKASSKPAFAIP